MASKNQVTLTFAGDASKLESAFDQVGDSAKNMGDDVKDSAKSFDSATDASDALDTKAMGFRDTVTGVQDSVKGFSQVLKGDLSGDALLTAGMGVGDLASGFTNLLGPALASSVSWLGKTRVGMLAQAAAGKVLAGATKVWAGIQAVFNAVMALNPVVLITLAIIALIVVVVIAYKRSETFRKIVQGAFRAVGKVVSWLGDRFSAMWGRIRSIFGRIVGFVKGLPGKIRRAASGMWNGIRDAFKNAINWIIDKWNGLSFTLPSVTIFGRTIGGGTISTPNLPRFHQGGRVPGSPGQEMLAVLQAGERVTPAGQAGRTVLEVRSGGSALDDLLVEVLARAVRVRGGDVQVVLGG